MIVTANGKSVEISSPSCVAVPDGFHMLCVMRMPNGEVINGREWSDSEKTDAQVIEFFAAIADRVLTLAGGGS